MCIWQDLRTKIINGYSESDINHTKDPQNHRKDSLSSNTGWSYLKISNIMEQLDQRITNIFCKEGIPVYIAHKTYTLKRALSHIITAPLFMSLSEYPLILVQRSCQMHLGVLWLKFVWSISPEYVHCPRHAVFIEKCCLPDNMQKLYWTMQHYTGSTTRFIHDREKETQKSKTSSINKHISWCQNTITMALR